MTGERDDLEQDARALLDRYETTIRREIEALGADHRVVSELDASASLLWSAVAQRREVHVGFLGEAQVGKSSLINALVGATVLPTGGVGPLTAQATRLSHQPSPRLHVRYHDRARFNQFLFAVRNYLAARGEIARPSDPDETLDSAGPWMVAEAQEPAARAAQNPTGEGLLAQARLMLRTQDSSLSDAALHDALRAVLELSPLGNQCNFEDLTEQITQIRNLLGTTHSVAAELHTREAFLSSLQANATGWRSPLVAELAVGIDSPLLSQVQVVDLPGVGVVADPAGHLAEQFVKDSANALVIVARNNGLTNEVVRLLERTGVVTRMLFGTDESRDLPIQVIFAITHLDNVADDRWKVEREQAKAGGQIPPKREAVFERLSKEMAAKTREQVRSTLLTSPAFDDLSDEQRARREQVVNDLCRRMEVICTSAKDFLNLRDEEDRMRAFVQNEAATNIPYFRNRLIELAERARGARRSRIQRALENFRGLLEVHLDALAAAPTSAAVDAATFQEQISVVVPRYRQRATEQRRAASRLLAENIPPKLGDVTQDAAERARKILIRLRKNGEGLPWATLNAALVRDGTWDKRGIDYPGTLTSSFVDVVAGSWEAAIQQEVRRIIRNLIDEHRELVEEFLTEATHLAGTDDLLQQLLVQKRILKEQGKNAVEWTAEHLNDLSEQVRKRISAVVARPIERACRDAVKSGQNHGQGARTRILDALEKGGRVAIENARESSRELLVERFETLRRSLDRFLRENDDPISQCQQAILRDQQASAERGEVERAHHKDAIARIRAAMRSPPTADEVTSVDIVLPEHRDSNAPVSGPVVPMRGAASQIFDFETGAE